MSWVADWKGISTKIKSFIPVLETFNSSVAVRGTDFHGVANSFLIPRAKATIAELLDYAARYQGSLPKGIDDAIKDLRDLVDGEEYSGVSGLAGLVLPLVATGAQVDHLTFDSEEQTRSRVLLAFKHLQRKLLVSSSVRNEWSEAFEVGETRCEAFGSIHLLEHQIWAFKAHSACERTDLILGGSVDITEQSRTGTALVLTEWKRVKSKDDAERLVQEALSQAKAYRFGSLAGFELKSEAYLVMVSIEAIKLPTSIQDGDVRYVPINIAVSPSTPSVAARNL